jgi:hypothetical protein
MLDLKIVLWLGYAFGYCLAVGPPIFIDPILASHTVYPSRHYPHALFCVPIYVALIGVVGVLLRSSSRILVLYLSVCIFTISIICSFPIFVPEVPHGNLLAVGLTTALLAAFTIFVWSMCDRMTKDSMSPDVSGEAGFEYLKVLFAFARQGAFAGVTLFGVFFFAAFTTEFKYIDITVSSNADKFWLILNAALQIAFFAIYAASGPIRYFFVMSLEILSQFKKIAAQIDSEERARAPKKETPEDDEEAGPIPAPG